MSDIIWSRGSSALEAFGHMVECSCDVRTLANGRRKSHEVVHSYTESGAEGPAYDPRMFPKGIWQVGRPEPRTSYYLSPFFIPTDAHQECEEWEVELTERGWRYVKPIGLVMDWAYGLHYSQSLTTLGCIRIADEECLRNMVARINDALDDGRQVTFEVV